MIFPFLSGFVAPYLAPLTFFLLAMNLLVFVSSHESYAEADKAIDHLLADQTFLETQGLAFASMILKEPESFNSTLNRLADRALVDESESRRMLGSLALRNVKFMSRAEKHEFTGDEIAISDWRKKFARLREAQSQHPSYTWGLSHWNSEWQQWVSYQFSHSGLLHLFWNMIFLLIFGAFVETKLGGSFVILTYIGGGVVGALVFSQLSGVSASPLVGASAAVSALMGLVAVAWFRKERVLFFYWLLPIRGYFGLVALPSWLVIIVSVIPDLSGYLAASRDIGSIAYSAHLGGALWGVVMAFFLAKGFLVSEMDEEDTGSSSHHNDQSDYRQAG